jgi:hypothetical protein
MTQFPFLQTIEEGKLKPPVQSAQTCAVASSAGQQPAYAPAVGGKRPREAAQGSDTLQASINAPEVQLEEECNGTVQALPGQHRSVPEAPDGGSPPPPKRPKFKAVDSEGETKANSGSDAHGNR